jgi:N-acetylglucosaminyldiphosphoundecaprenol N-acetyl-beta-D-mannosaminyltransferase
LKRPGAPPQGRPAVILTLTVEWVRYGDSIDLFIRRTNLSRRSCRTEVVVALDAGFLRIPTAGHRQFDIPAEIIGGLPIAVLDRSDTARFMVEAALARRRCGQPALALTSANGQVLSLCRRDTALCRLFLDFDVIHADGMPLVFASRLLCETALPERVATTDLFHDVAEVAQQRGVTFYLLGGTKAVMDAAVRRVRRHYPNLDIVGYRHGYFRPGEEDETIDAINAARPDILWVGMGVPAEQTFAMRHRDRLNGVGIIKTSGGLFDFLSGKARRAPNWMQAGGFEWVFRMLREPRRLAVRYLTTGPHAIFLLLTQTQRSAGRR